MHTTARTSLVLAASIPLALAACGGSNGGSSASTASTSSTRPGGITGPTGPPAPLPYALGTRAALGDWELAVDTATPGATTTITARLNNVSGAKRPAPPSTVFTLQSGTTGVPVGAQVTGLPASMAPNVDTPITITFVGTTAPADPYLHWSGTSKGAVEGTFKLTPGDPTIPVG